MKGFWEWLWKVAEPGWHRECLAFVKGLVAEEGDNARVEYKKHLGFLHDFSIFLGRIKISLEYNSIRKEWRINIWSRDAREFLFYHDILDSTPHKVIHFLLDHFAIRPMLQEVLTKKQEEKKDNKEMIKEIIQKYTQGRKEGE